MISSKIIDELILIDNLSVNLFIKWIIALRKCLMSSIRSILHLCGENETNQ